jgi:cellulose biosynthesis protein BcsQ
MAPAMKAMTDRKLTISVAAGKGGTGKTLISCSLAQALAAE